MPGFKAGFFFPFHIIRLTPQLPPPPGIMGTWGGGGEVDGGVCTSVCVTVFSASKMKVTHAKKEHDFPAKGSVVLAQ